MLLAEEFLLLCLDDESGKKTLSSDKLAPALGGALLVELALAERIAVTPRIAGWRRRGRVSVTSTVPTDDPELDRVLEHIQQHEGVKASALVSDMSGKRITKKLADRLVLRLQSAGVVAEERSKVLGVRSWPLLDRAPKEEIRRRLQSALVDGTTPLERTVALVALLHATGHVSKVVAGEDKKAVRARAKALSEGDWAAAAVKRAIDEMAAAASG